AEDTGLILPLGQWVLETACLQLAAWAGQPATAGLSIAVNVSVRQFRHPDFIDTVIATIARTGIAPQRLKLELTESLLADRMEITMARMGTLKALGVTLALDDFGMGYSSLSVLKRLPLDQLKIDRSFVADLLTDPNDAAISRAIVTLAQSLGLDVVAEGVETLAQRDFLIGQGCEQFQGYLFSKPLPIGQLEAYLHTQAADPAA
ncbi:MAG: EAL domain-containing protein, partial [Polaromonas sp.]|nr:EAL domain-containing protein [Polaromonas sp.]